MTKTSTLFCVVIEGVDGGQRMNSFTTKAAARKEAQMTVEMAEKYGYSGRVYLSELPYDRRKNMLLSNRLVDEFSELIYNGKRVDENMNAR